MANIELVIKIPEERYNQILDKDYILGHYLEIAVRKGTPLPKGHDRLIEADALLDKAKDYGEGQLSLILIDPYFVKNAQTIVEADRSEE